MPHALLSLLVSLLHLCGRRARAARPVPCGHVCACAPSLPSRSPQRRPHARPAPSQGSLKSLKISGPLSKVHALALIIGECESNGDARIGLEFDKKFPQAQLEFLEHLLGTRLLAIPNRLHLQGYCTTSGEYLAYLVLMGIKELSYNLEACEIELKLSARRWNMGGISVGAPISPSRPAAGMHYSLLKQAWVSEPEDDEMAEVARHCMRFRWYERLYGMSSL